MSDDSLSNRLRQIDNYIENLYSSNDEALNATLKSIAEHGLPPINVSPNEGKLLYMLAKISGARKILEIGTLAGYSTIWLARALPPGGRLLTLEYDPKHAEVARANIARAGLGGVVEVRLGAGLDLLPEIAANREGPFDLFFIDADKGAYPDYLDWAITLSRPGSLILSDNLIREGAVMGPNPDDQNAVAIARYNRKLATHPRLESLVLPIIREYIDGLGITLVVH